MGSVSSPNCTAEAQNDGKEGGPLKPRTRLGAAAAGHAFPEHGLCPGSSGKQHQQRPGAPGGPGEGGGVWLLCRWLPSPSFLFCPVPVKQQRLIVTLTACALPLLLMSSLLSRPPQRQHLQSSPEATQGLEPPRKTEVAHTVLAPAALSPACNLFSGRWVRDKAYPLYEGKSCRWVSKNWACRLGQQRPSFEYEKFRWQPHGCDLPRFNASDFLDRLANKLVAFMGDSLGRQQFESLLCLLDPLGPVEQPRRRRRSRAPTPDPSRAVDVGTRFGFHMIPGTRRPTGWAYRFPRSNTTVLFRWSTGLCLVEAVDAGNKSAGMLMHLDRPDDFLQGLLPHVHVLVLNTGHHWNRGKLKDHHFVVNGTRLDDGESVKAMRDAHSLAVSSVAAWVNSELLHRAPAVGAHGASEAGPLVMLRARSPRHFFKGEWDSGGGCDHVQGLLTPQQLANLTLGGDKAMAEAVAAIPSLPGQLHSVEFLNISFLSSWRGDAHPAKWDFRGVNPEKQDCLHWCLPGVPDVWNEILYARLRLHQERQRGNISIVIPDIAASSAVQTGEK